MLIYDDGATEVLPCSGTLVEVAGNKGIVTARHVWDKAKNHELLLIPVGQGNYAFERNYLLPLIPASTTILKEFQDVRVPDIAFLKFPDKYASDLEAKGKAFFNIDKRVKNRSYLPEPGLGYWTIFGNPYEWLDIGNKIVPSFVYGTGVARQFEENGWDYYVMRLDVPANPDIPRDFHGMSGGGIWWTRWGCDERHERFFVEDFSKDILVAGVSFYQTDPHDRMIIGHGPKSIYEILYQHVLGSI